MTGGGDELEEMRDAALKVNVGAGREKIKGWVSFDLPPEENVTYTDVGVTPDIVGDAMDLPFEDDSVDILRTRDLLMDFEAEEAGRLPALAREFYRVLKPGGRLITIEIRGFHRKFSGPLRIESIRKGGRVPYLPRGGRFLVTTYVKD